MRKFKPMPSVQDLESIVDADFQNGILIWKTRSGNHSKWWNENMAGKPVGTASKVYGGSRVRLFGQLYYLHRILYKMATGKDPHIVDHIDGDRSNNRLSNLRAGNETMNAKNKARYRNNTSGEANIQRHHNKWRVRFKVDGVHKTFGCFEKMSDAIKVRDATKELLGFSSRHGEAA